MLVTQIKVVSGDAQGWGTDWLDARLSEVAAYLKMDMKQREGEEQGGWRVYTFGVGTQAALHIARDALALKQTHIHISRGSVMVKALGPANWLRRQGPVDHPYHRAWRRQAKELSEHLGDWWAGRDRRLLLVRESPDSGRPWLIEDRGRDLFVDAQVDLAILDRTAPEREVEQAADTNLVLIVEQVGKYFRVDPHY